MNLGHFNQGKPIQLLIGFKDKNKQFVDPTSPTVKFYNPSDTLDSTYVPTKTATGQYEVEHQIGSNDTLGKWKIIIDATYGSLTDTSTVYFVVTSW